MLRCRSHRGVQVSAPVQVERLVRRATIVMAVLALAAANVHCMEDNAPTPRCRLAAAVVPSIFGGKHVAKQLVVSSSIDCVGCVFEVDPGVAQRDAPTFNLWNVESRQRVLPERLALGSPFWANSVRISNDGKAVILGGNFEGKAQLLLFDIARNAVRWRVSPEDVGRIHTVDVSPDGAYVAADVVPSVLPKNGDVRRQRFVVLINAVNGHEVARSRTGAGVSQVIAFAEGSDAVVSLTRDNALFRYDLSLKESVIAKGDVPDVRGVTVSVDSVAHDRRKRIWSSVVSRRGEKPTTFVTIRDCRKRDIEVRHEEMTAINVRSAMSDDGTALAVAFNRDETPANRPSTTATVLLFDGNDWTKRELCRIADDIESIALSGDGKYVLLGTRKGVVDVRDRASGKQIVGFKPLKGHSVAAMVFSPDGTHLITSCDDEKGVSVWRWKDIIASVGKPPRK